MPRILVSGSLAYDHLYTFPGVFQNELNPAATLQNLSVAFNVKNKTVHFGGCAGNIAYNAKLLNEDVLLLGIAGKDFGEYEKWLQINKISTDCIIRDSETYTSQATVVTDQKGQQITFFHEGASAESKRYKLQIKETIIKHKNELAVGIVSPNHRDFMLASIEACEAINLPFFFDPGQAMPLFSKQELQKLAQKSWGVMMNEYECEMFQKNADVSFAKMLKLAPLFIITLGENGSRIHFEGETITIPAEKIEAIKDPTGCGDAYRAGLLIGLQNDMKNMNIKILEEAATLGTKLAAACLQKVGTQNHRL